ncbi:MAG TPA: phytanoyl-CoA dioxygenase family protein [Fimbriimonas sp.]|nr:phytanoyl-CoA dioxygenase family protein [Fimbriimonas sp.]
MTTKQHLSSNGVPLDADPSVFGELRRSDDIFHDTEMLRERMAQDGYLLLPGLLDRKEVLDARASITDQFASEGILDPSEPSIKAIAKPGVEMYFRPDVANHNERVERVIYGARMLGFFERFLGGEVRHYDFTWVRAVAHGLGTCPHCDIVYMGRGTTNLYTAWTPLADIPLELGGLIVLENSHKIDHMKQTYGKLDVDAMCENSSAGRNVVEARGYEESGAITLDPRGLREKLGGRWLTTEYKMGDVLIFSMFTIHGSLDNQTHEIRLSTDSRYQLASEPYDERWVGEEPIGHGPAAKRNLIC